MATTRTRAMISTSSANLDRQLPAYLQMAEPPMTNKRSSSSPSLDCLSLQSSLKRVRLSCSPGELRLQRDLRFLPTMGWRLAEENPGSSIAAVSWDANPRWLFQGPVGGTPVHAELQLLDPLRLVLRIQRCRLWIQIPRMYPHRPPVISRLENMPMDHIIIAEELPLHCNSSSSSDMPQGQDTVSSSPEESSMNIQGSTLIYKEWSPVRHLGDLLVFLLHTAARRPLSRSSSMTTSASTSSMTATSSSIRRTPLTFPLTSAATSSSSLPDVSSSASTVRMGPTTPNKYFFMEEHKMEDVGGGGYAQHHYHDVSTNISKPCTINTAMAPIPPFAPNRFDAGYGKYKDPFDLRSSSSSGRSSGGMVDGSCNAMEL